MRPPTAVSVRQSCCPQPTDESRPRPKHNDHNTKKSEKRNLWERNINWMYYVVNREPPGLLLLPCKFRMSEMDAYCASFSFTLSYKQFHGFCLRARILATVLIKTKRIYHTLRVLRVSSVNGAVFFPKKKKKLRSEYLWDVCFRSVKKTRCEFVAMKIFNCR